MMISRKRILSNSCNHLPMFGSQNYINTDEDVWFEKEKLYKDHIQEILNKYQQLDDEIWGKIICMERNRRVAKAYARAPVLTVTGGDEGFDGYSIGLGGFENPHRDSKVVAAKRSISEGIKIRVDENGDVLVRPLAKRNFFAKEWHQNYLEPQSSCISDEIIKARGRISMGKSSKLFEMKKFMANVGCELLNEYPDRRKLEYQCISVISLAAKDAPDSELLQLPTWIMVINIVALEILKSKLPLGDNTLKRTHKSLMSLFDVNSLQKLKDQSDEVDGDPYSLTNSSSSTSGYGRDSRSLIMRNSSSSTLLSNTMTTGRRRQRVDAKIFKKEPSTRSMSLGSTLRLQPYHSSSRTILEDLPLPDYDEEDPYYSGYQARVPTFDAQLEIGSKKSPTGKGCLNSVLRHLPIQAATRDTTTPPKSLSSSGSSAAQDSDEIYHIYSSIADAKVSAKKTKKSKAKRSASIPKTWRFFMHKK